MFVRFGCVLRWIRVFMPCMGKQMLDLGKALIGKLPKVQRIQMFREFFSITPSMNKALLQDMSLSLQSPTRLQSHKEWMAAICASSLLICRSELTPSQMRTLAPSKFVILCWWNQEEKNDKSFQICILWGVKMKLFLHPFFSHQKQEKNYNFRLKIRILF